MSSTTQKIIPRKAESLEKEDLLQQRYDTALALSLVAKVLPSAVALLADLGSSNITVEQYTAANARAGMGPTVRAMLVAHFPFCAAAGLTLSLGGV